MPYRKPHLSMAGMMHLHIRGVDQRWIFKYDHFKQELLRRLEQESKKHDVTILAYVVMDNHYHFIVQSVCSSVSKMMQTLNRCYSAYFNSVNGRLGTLYEGRYHSHTISSAGWAVNRSLYLHLNPVLPGMCTMPEGYRWSSARAYLGMELPPPWLRMEPILRLLSPDLTRAQQQYRRALERASVLGLRRPDVQPD